MLFAPLRSLAPDLPTQGARPGFPGAQAQERFGQAVSDAADPEIDQQEPVMAFEKIKRQVMDQPQG